MTRPKIPDGDMNVTTARKRWTALREAAYSGDQGAMIEAVSRFEGIVDTILMYWEER